MALQKTNVPVTTVTRNIRTRGLKKFETSFVHNVEGDEPTPVADLDHKRRAAHLLEEKRIAQRADRVI